jgi:hypothetical protein
LDTLTGQLDEYPAGNLMGYANVMFLCDSNLNTCDQWQNSAWDPVLKTLYYQGHYIDPQSGEPTVLMNYLGFDNNIVNGNLTWYFNYYAELPFGLAGFQFVPFV